MQMGKGQGWGYYSRFFISLSIYSSAPLCPSPIIFNLARMSPGFFSSSTCSFYPHISSSWSTWIVFLRSFSFSRTSISFRILSYSACSSSTWRVAGPIPICPARTVFHCCYDTLGCESMDAFRLHFRYGSETTILGGLMMYWHYTSALCGQAIGWFGLQ